MPDTAANVSDGGRWRFLHRGVRDADLNVKRCGAWNSAKKIKMDAVVTPLRAPATHNSVRFSRLFIYIAIKESAVRRK